jgi:hypothetical protein
VQDVADVSECALTLNPPVAAREGAAGE